MISVKNLIKTKRFKNFYKSLEELHDPRVKGKIKHKLSDCLIIIILASLSGCNIFREYISFANKYKRKLKDLFGLPNGIPSHDTLERIIHRIRHSELENIFVRRVMKLIDMPRIVSLDGKYIKGTRDSSKEKTSAQDIVTIYDVINKVPLISKKVASGKNKKGGEQGAIEYLLRKYHRLHPKNKLIISIDAIGANQYITKLCDELGYGFVINIKREDENGLGGIIKDDFDVELANASSRLSKLIIQESKSNHGRMEKRTFYLINDMSYVECHYPKISKSINAIGLMKSEVLNIKQNVVTTQDRYFLLSDMDIKTFSLVKRKHWNIESFHYILDNSFKEDRCTTRKGLGAINLNLIRKFVYTIINASNSCKSFNEARSENKYLTPRQLLYKIIYAKNIKSV